MAFKIRCSAIKKIMAKPRSKDDLISAGAKTYCSKWLQEQIYGAGKEIDSKYIHKGNMTEPESIEMIGKYFGFNAVKNEQEFSDNEIQGTPDVIYDTGSKKIIYDAKSSWDHVTFPLLYTSLPNDDYAWQMQGYMALTGATTSWVVYVLNDTPEELLDGPMVVYSDLPINRRVKAFQVNRDEDKIMQIREHVTKCNEWLYETYSDEFAMYLI